ncbi:MAG: hypothetical protein AUI14_08995 [Actinobacteria bacterium 13_2_20CM_2_71_6]|nr:MAG: hypothetical protein AUI14_08995 [Actinobacteria bacterium 13_2_20CM_2_71_6]
MEFRLLGPMQVEHDGGRVDLGRRRERCLLGLLLLEPGKVLLSDRLLDLLWDGEPPDTGLGQLRSNISRLRNQLRVYDGGQGAIRIRTHGTGYSVEVDPERVDVHRFKRLLTQATQASDPLTRAGLLRAALGLWHGPVMVDVMSDLLRERVAGGWEELRLTALERLAEADLLAGPARDVVTDMTELTARHPLWERFTALLMTAHFQAGNQAEASQAYHRLRDGLAGQLGLDPSAGLSELHDRILRQDPTLLTPGAGSIAASAARVDVPAQLPADVPDFTGRTDALKELDNLLTGGSRAVVVSALAGTGGVGKTALAVHWAHGVRDRFPDGQLYVNLRGYSSDPPVPAGHVLTRFLRALGVAGEQVPADGEEAAGMYRSLLAGKRILVVLDNARTADQVRPLLPGSPTCRVVITSRDRLDGLVARDGVRRLTLGVLPPDEALTLLGTLLGPERVDAEYDAAVRLGRLCGYLPLALRIAAALSTAQPGRSLARFVADLDGPGRLDALAVERDPQAAVRAAFDLSYDALEAESQRLFGCVGLVPGPDFTVPVAAALLDGTEERAERLLDRLVGAHLVEEYVPGRFALHDLLRQYAAERAGEHDEGRGPSAVV